MLSIKDTRKTLGKEYEHRTDDEIEQIRDGAYEGILNKKETAQNENEDLNYGQTSNKK